MNKQRMIDFINDHYDWFERMQQGLGHHSWWYTNRSPEDCINVKLYNWFNIEDLEEKLTDQDKKLIEQLNFNIYEVIDYYSWNVIISDERDNLEYDLKEKFNVDKLEYGGQQGGWLAVVYNWDWVPNDYDIDEYSYQEVRRFYQIIKKAIKEDGLVTDYILDRKKSLDEFLSNADNFIDEIKTCLYNTLEDKQEAAARAEKIRKAKSLGVYQLIKYRLEQLRHEILAESISTDEIVELQGLSDFIEDGDVLLLEWAEVEEGSR